MTEGEALAALRGRDPAEAAEAEALLWRLWCRSGRDDVDALLDQGIEAMEEHELDRAETIFTRIIEHAPDFAEGWNKRATVRYLAEDYEGSIADGEETLVRNPSHFGALSGQGLCHLALGRPLEAAALFMRTLSVHPHLAAAQRNLAEAMDEAADVGDGDDPAGG